jgi:hypothetical protein
MATQEHTENIKVYCTTEDLERLEMARMLLRRQHRIKVDRGTIVRTVVAHALGRLEAEDVKRLAGLFTDQEELVP